ncbi:Probable gamma-secretase subunit PEN-2 [Linum perenne]
MPWPTIDGPLGLTEEESLAYARRLYGFGYTLLPWLWAVNCFYFWPVLRHSRPFPLIRPCNLCIPLRGGNPNLKPENLPVIDPVNAVL